MISTAKSCSRAIARRAGRGGNAATILMRDAVSATSNSMAVHLSPSPPPLVSCNFGTSTIARKASSVAGSDDPRSSPRRPIWSTPLRIAPRSFTSNRSSSLIGAVDYSFTLDTGSNYRCYGSDSSHNVSDRGGRAPAAAGHLTDFCDENHNDDSSGKTPSEFHHRYANTSTTHLRYRQRLLRQNFIIREESCQDTSFVNAAPIKRHMSSSKSASSATSGNTKSGTNNSSSGTATKHSTAETKKTPAGGSKFSTQAKIPTPKSGASSSLSSLVDPKKIMKTVLETTWWFAKALVMFVIKLPYNTWFYATKPQERREKIQEIKDTAKKEFDHYWVGTKLLMADVRTAQNLLGKTLQGSTLTRRERKQLLRTVSDLFRLVPFSMFLIIPLMEFALPFALRLFPNMLPSTFQDSLKHEENMKRELQSRIAMVQFFQETMEELAKQQKQIAARRKDDQDELDDDSIASKQESCAADMLKFLDRARKGEPIPPEVIIQYANYFQDDLTLDNMPRMQLINMCKYMSIPPYGADSFLRFQLRHRIRMLKEDDQRIIWEGIDSLTKMELREACQERGMRSTGLSKEAYKRSLQQWLDLSVNKNVPISLLIMSRIFFLQDELTAPAATDESKSVAGLADAISGMDKEVLNDVILNVATSEERKSDLDVRKIQLEVLTHQNEKIKEEQLERAAAAKKKEMAERAAEQTAALAEEEILTKPMIPEAVTVTVGIEKMTEQELSDAIDKKVKEVKMEIVEKAAEVELGERELTPEEMEAISQLLSADPVLKEREDLARIKEAIKRRIEKKDETSSKISEDTTVASLCTGGKVDNDEAASAAIAKMESKAANEASTSTKFTIEESQQSTDDTLSEPSVEDEEAEDPVVARLKKRIESMVDKIEGQLSDVHVKIGDKLHYLDKDMDGILSREEMAEVLCQVLKNITPEEALEIADEMDENKDGVFTVEELINWIETNRLVKYVDEGRDAEMEKIMESSHSSDSSKERDTKEIIKDDSKSSSTTS